MRRKKPVAKSEASSKPKQPPDEDSWREPLEAITINDDEWWCIVVMMVETIVEHSRCVSLFTAAAEEGKRKAIHSLSRGRALAQVRALSKQSLDSSQVLQGVCHHANKVLNENNDVLPSWLMARVIKYLIYRAREESIGVVKRLADLEREIDEEYWIMQTAADWGQSGTKGFNPESFNRKANTKLRKRGEEWRDVIYVDDAPLNGPHLYIILTGFHEPDLPEHLINAGVPLSLMMQIKRPGEKLNRLHDVAADSPGTKRHHRFLDEYRVSKAKLLNFWPRVKRCFTDPEQQHQEYSDIAFIVFCPPKLPETSDDDDEQRQRLKKDMYDRVSYIVYDFYELYRQHASYLRSMKVESSILDESTESGGTDVYENFLDMFPFECVTVPLILFAILMQVDANERKVATEDSIDENNEARVSEKIDVETETEAELADQSLITLVEQNAKTLNVKFGLDDEEHGSDNGERSVIDIELIPHGDGLLETLHLLNDSAMAALSEPMDLLNSVLPVFWHPIIASHHENRDITNEKLNQYTRHIDNVRQHFEIDVTNEDIKHHLHTLIFDKMMSKRVKADVQKATIRAEATEHGMRLMGSSCSMKKCRSLPSLSCRFTPEVHFLSDGNIEYGKVVPEILECSPLFDLIDPRELLVPGYLEENVFHARKDSTEPLLEDVSDVELLSAPIFLQLVHRCLLEFDRMELRHVEPTDSLLLCFRDKRRIDGVQEEEKTSSVRTPVRLHDFCKYVVPEEKDWLRLEEERYKLQTAALMEGLMGKSSEMFEETMVFTDEDFILPGTLKARELRKRRELDERKNDLGADIPAGSFADGARNRKKGRKKSDVAEEKKSGGKKEAKSKRSETSTARKSSSKKPDATSRLALTQDDDVKEEPAYDFVGYDLGRLRVQVTNNKKTFYSADETFVRVEIDDWLYKMKHMRISVTVHGYTLKLNHRMDNQEQHEVFHLTSETGIVLAFQKPLTPPSVPQNPLLNWKQMDVEFKASWPTGLTVEPITGDEPRNPYYIQQSYIKGYCDSKGSREVRRKFLRNGTILKYLDDGRVIVLRPNGVIVTCIEFQDANPKQQEDHKHRLKVSRSAQVNTSAFALKRTRDSVVKGDRAKETRPPAVNRKRSMGSSKTQLLEKDSEPAKRNSMTDHVDATSVADNAVKVSRYTVLNHDGGRYEVVDDLIVSEQHRLLVRTASDYEVDEKFTRRADGTNMLLNSKGELIVRFPDGTRITTCYTIEEEPVTCDWTEEEILRYFLAAEGLKEEEDEQQLVYPSLSSLDQSEEGIIPKRHEGRITELLMEDSYVSVLLACRMEHKNYATVSYDQSALSCTLSMPDDLRVSISGRGHYEVSMADGVNLKISDDCLRFKGNACTICGSQSTSTYNFFPFEPSASIFTTVDVQGNVFDVKGNGATRYQTNAERRSKLMERMAGKSDECHEYETEEEGIHVPACNHERLCFKRDGVDYRIFSMNRDLTAYEYIHRLTRNRIELAALYDEETSLILYSSSQRSQLCRLIIYEPVGDESRLKAALSFPDFQVRPTNFDRTSILRSTYSIPYDWLFPFGRKGNGIWKNTHDQPLMATAEGLPELLKVRVLCGFKQPHRNAVIDLQRALGRYWMSLVNGTVESRTCQNDKEEESVREIPRTIYDHLDDNLRNLALGIKTTVDVETYKFGLERRWMSKQVRHRRKSKTLVEFLEHKAVEKKVQEWYKCCMRDKYVLPYFKNITGSCFLWVMSCVEKAVDVSAGTEKHEQVVTNSTCRSTSCRGPCSRRNISGD